MRLIMSKVFGKSCFTDLNIIPQDSKSVNNGILQFLADYGYERVAFNHEVNLVKKVQIKAAPDITSLVDTIPIPKGCRSPMQVLQRLTVIVEDSSVLHALSSPNLDCYDLVAICPGTDKVLQQSCSVLNVDIISMKLDQRLPFKMKHAQIGQAVERGIYFEICYSPAIKDATARRNTLANAMELVDVARRKNIIVSSQAEKGLDTRAPADVINLCHLFGLSGGMCKSSITSNCRAALLHSAMSRMTAKGVVSSELISKDDEASVANMDTTDCMVDADNADNSAEPSNTDVDTGNMDTNTAKSKSKKRKRKNDGEEKDRKTKWKK